MYCIIFNPTAGAGRSAKAMEAVSRRLKEKNVEYILQETQYKRHSVLLAREAMGKGYDGIISVGGDGTLLEIAEVLQGTDETLGVIPAGTGNDFRKSINVPRDPVEALDVILAGNKKRVDVGMFGDDHCFLNVAGIGFDVEVIKNTEKVRRRFTGGFAYFLGIIMSLTGYKDIKLTLTVNGETVERTVLLMAVANGKSFGGGLEISPDSLVDDGLFNIVIVNRLPHWRILFELPKMKNGTIFKIRECEKMSCSEIYISSEKPLSFDLDGDIFGQTPVRLSIKPGALSVFCP